MPYIFTKITIIACIISAAWLAFNSIEGWGWFLTVGFIIEISKTIEISKGNIKEE
jgi:hypothetical protein